MSLRATTKAGRIGAVLLSFVDGCHSSLYSSAFFNDFTTAVGLFLSFGIIVFHWIFQLHRLTNGLEANWLEPIFVVFGLVAVYYGMRKEIVSSSK